MRSESGARRTIRVRGGMLTMTRGERPDYISSVCYCADTRIIEADSWLLAPVFPRRWEKAGDKSMMG